VEVLQFAKSCFGYEISVVEDIRGWKADWDARAGGIVQVSHAEKRDGVVCLSCYCNTV